MSDLIENLVKLGLKEYEAKIYVALVGIREANARTIHEISGVPRPRVYDILSELTAKGFVEVREGSPLFYRFVPPDVVIAKLQKDLNHAAEESIAVLETLSTKKDEEFVPLWHVKGDWSITRHLNLLIERMTGPLSILVLEKQVPERYDDQIREAAKKGEVSLLFKPDIAYSGSRISGVSYYQIDQMNEFFRENIFEKAFANPLVRKNQVFFLECLIISTDAEVMSIYTINDERMAFINTLPISLYLQNMTFEMMLSGALKSMGDDRVLPEIKDD
nr:helix-turn-helix domain-containing protein [uncultured Methanospirillum sp.]